MNLGGDHMRGAWRDMKVIQDALEAKIRELLKSYTSLENSKSYMSVFS